MERLNFKNDWPMPNDFMLELGRISAIWLSLENTVNLSIGKLAGYDEVYDYRAAILLAHANFKQRIEILETLFEQCSKEHKKLKHYEPIIKKIKSAQKGRNRFIHNSISFNFDSNCMEIVSLSARGTMKTTIAPVNINELKEVTAKIHESMCELHTIITGNKLTPMWEKE